VATLGLVLVQVPEILAAPGGVKWGFRVSERPGLRVDWAAVNSMLRTAAAERLGTTLICIWAGRAPGEVSVSVVRPGLNALTFNVFAAPAFHDLVPDLVFFAGEAIFLFPVRQVTFALPGLVEAAA
jgi:hypothetical protein